MYTRKFIKIPCPVCLMSVVVTMVRPTVDNAPKLTCKQPNCHDSKLKIIIESELVGDDGEVIVPEPKKPRPEENSIDKEK